MSTILVGSAPDSWGVWFPDDPNQTPYTRFLDEVAASGYEWIELGPFGYLPTDPKKLSDELAARNLKLSAGTVFEHLHQDEFVGPHGLQCGRRSRMSPGSPQPSAASTSSSSPRCGATPRPARCSRTAI